MLHNYPHFFSLPRVSYRNFSWEGKTYMHAKGVCTCQCTHWGLMKFWTCLTTSIVRFSYSALVLYLCRTFLLCCIGNYDTMIFKFLGGRRGTLSGGRNPSAPPSVMMKPCYQYGVETRGFTKLLSVDMDIQPVYLSNW